eukprot:2864550-Pleurochrysis_carterae.AAC.1
MDKSRVKYYGFNSVTSAIAVTLAPHSGTAVTYVSGADLGDGQVYGFWTPRPHFQGPQPAAWLRGDP